MDWSSFWWGFGSALGLMSLVSCIVFGCACRNAILMAGEADDGAPPVSRR